MKKTTTLLFSLGIVLSVFGQSSFGPLNKEAKEEMSRSEKAKYSIAFVENFNSFKTTAAKLQLDSTLSAYEYGGMWRIDDKEEFKYDSQGRFIEMTDYDHDTSSGWEPDDKYQYFYNSAGLLDYFIELDYDDQTMTWENDYKYSFTYDANGRLIQEIEYYWNSGVSMWANGEKDMYFYNANGTLDSILELDWNDPAWENYYLTKFTYNGKNLMTQEIEYYWDYPGWEQDYKYDYTYDMNDYQIRMIESYMNGGMWEENSKDSNVYNGLGQLVEEYWSYMSISNGWELDRKYENTYDSGNNLFETVEYYYKSSASTWYMDEKYMFDIDLMYTKSDLWVPLDYDFNNKVDEFKAYDYDDNNMKWELRDSLVAYYSPPPIGLVEEQLNGFKIYPNPVQNVLYIDATINTWSFGLYDITGKLIKKDYGNIGVYHLDVSDVLPGMYLLQIESDEKKAVKKLIKL